MVLVLTGDSQCCFAHPAYAMGPRTWKLLQADLPAMEKVRREELTAELARDERE